MNTKYDFRTAIELPIGGNCRYFFNHSTLISECDSTSEIVYSNQSLFGTQRIGFNSNYELHDGHLIQYDNIYAIHDEGSGEDSYYKHVYDNLIVEYIKGEHTQYLSKPLGCGSNLHMDIIIKNCIFKNGKENVSDVSWHFPNNAIGNGSGQVQYSYVNTDAEGTETQASQYANRYRGIENPFGHIWKNCCDIVVTGTDNKIYVTNNKENFGIDKSLYEDSGLTTLTTNEQWVKRITNNAAADLFCQEGGAGPTTYFCDRHWTNAVEADRTLLLGADAGNGSPAGLFGLHSYIGLGNAHAFVGTRLVYIP